MTEHTKPDPVKIALEALFQQYRGIEEMKGVAQRKILDLEARAAKLRPKITTLAAICEDNIDPDSELAMFLVETAAAGITDGVRAVLKGSSKWMSPSDIRNGLVRFGYDLDGYTNILATIHTILKRLREKKEVVKGVRKPSREAVYRWAIYKVEEDKKVVEETSKDAG